MAAASCKSDSTLGTNPVDTTGTGGGGGGGVVKAALVVSAGVDPADASVRDALGWAAGVPGAEVTIARAGSATSTLTATTDASGVARFSDLLTGTWTVSSVRLLSATERARLGTTDADVNALGGGATVNVIAPSTNASVALAAGHPGSLVISELFAGRPNGGEAGEYPLASYIELYNNSDTTIYLDGMIVGRGHVFTRDYPSPISCADMKQWRDDALGIWSQYFYQFPGTGRTYSLLPGQATVVATDAIDERDLYPELMDLSGSRFEFVGPSDVDNPSAVNMINVGPGEYAASAYGHGLFWSGVGVTAFVASPMDVSSLTHANLTATSGDHARIPADKLLDVFTTDVTPSFGASLQYASCGDAVSAAFDRQQATLLDYATSVSLQRKVLFQDANGRKVLQRTRTSSRDFARLPWNPGTIP